MLQRLRNHSGKWFIKVLFGAIVVSFAFFGIGDIIKGYFMNRPVVKVGSMSLGIEKFLQQMQDLTSRAQYLAQGKISPQDIKKLNLQQKVIDQFSERAAIEQEVERLNLDVSNATIRNYIQSIPAFQSNGLFDRELFDQVIRQSHKTETNFISDFRRDLMAQQLLDSLANGVNLPKVYLEKITNAIYRNFIFSAVLIKNEAIKVSKSASDEDLKLTYKQNIESFKIPEFRSAQVLIIDNKKLLSGVEVPLKNLKAEYDQRKSDFVVPERRLVTKMTLPSRKLADDAIIKLKMGRPIKAVIRDLKAGEFQEELVEKNQLPEGVRDEVFKLGQNGISKPYNRGIGFGVYIVNKIEKSETKTFDQVKDQIIDDLKMQKMSDHLKELQNRIEDAIAAGQTFDQIAKAEKIDVVKLDSFNKKGIGRDHKNVTLPTLIKDAKKVIIEHAFNLQPSQESPLLDVNSNVSIIVSLDKIEKETTPPLEKIKEDVGKKWREEQKKKAALELATTLYKDARNLKDLSGLASKEKLKMIQGAQVSRMSFEKFARDTMDGKTDNQDDNQKSLKAVGIYALEKVFTLKHNQAAVGQTEDGYAVIMLEEIQPGDVQDKDKNQLKSFFNQQLQEDVLSLFINSLKTKLTVSINQELVKQLAQGEE